MPASCVVHIQLTLSKKTEPKAKTIPVPSSSLTSPFAFFQKIARIVLLHCSAQNCKIRVHPIRPSRCSVTTRQEPISRLHGFSLIVINDF